jgi:superfamily I DNA/RNA helicase
MNDTWWVNPDQLDDDQKKVVELSLKGSHLIKGPPGSGKTNLLLLRANYMDLAGMKDIVAIVFTRTLQEFLATGGARYSFSSKKLKTCRRWEQDFLLEYGIKANPPDDFDDQRTYFLEEIGKVIEKRKLKSVYDAILLDEAQDYWPEEITMFGKLAKVIFAVADPGQKIYGGPDPLDALERLPVISHELRLHYRNGPKICLVADEIAKGMGDSRKMITSCNYKDQDNPSSAELFQLPSIEKQAAKIIERLETQLKAFPDQLLGVICPRHEELDKVWDLIAASPVAKKAILQKSSHYVPFDGKKRICVCTLHSAKGLEFRTLHIAGTEFISNFSYGRNMIYTGVTRAKTSLSIYHSDPIPGYLEKAIGKALPPTDPPKLKDAFGR